MKPILPEVESTIHHFLKCDFCNPSAVYSNGRITRRFVEQAREDVAKAIGADSDEIYFTSGATEAINWFFYTLWASKQMGQHILTTKIEHKAILRQVSRYDGCMHYFNLDERGRVICKGLNNILDCDTTIVIGYTNNEIGTIQPIKEISDVCHECGSRIFVDATQAISSLPINVHDLGVDYLCGSGQKIGALSGCGFLYVKKGSPLEPMILGGEQEHGMRSGTENVLGILALGTAINVVTKDLDIKISETTQKRDKIISSLLELPKAHLNGSTDNRICNNINISFEGIEAESLVLQLDTRGIKISAGSACNSASYEPSHVLKAIGLTDDMARSSIRITIGNDITDEEIDYLVKNVKECVERLRRMSPQWKKIMGDKNGED